MCIDDKFKQGANTIYITLQVNLGTYRYPGSELQRLACHHTIISDNEARPASSKVKHMTEVFIGLVKGISMAVTAEPIVRISRRPE
jgi:hypothetical protein